MKLGLSNASHGGNVEAPGELRVRASELQPGGVARSRISMKRQVISIAFAICAGIAAAGMSFSTALSQNDVSPVLIPLGMNEIRSGVKVFFPTNLSMREPWWVQNPKFEYPDGEKGVLLRSKYGIATVPFTQAGELLIEH
jgi:hypothetical protein